jgi:hypothetical protein
MGLDTGPAASVSRGVHLGPGRPFHPARPCLGGVTEVARLARTAAHHERDAEVVLFARARARAVQGKRHTRVLWRRLPTGCSPSPE